MTDSPEELAGRVLLPDPGSRSAEASSAVLTGLWWYHPPCIRSRPKPARMGSLERGAWGGLLVADVERGILWRAVGPW